jgi:hypothetical protein
LKTWLKLSLAVIVFLSTSCGSPIVYYVTKKTETIERNAPPQAGWKRYDFSWQEPRGQVNLLWVVDNTATAEIITDKPPGKSTSRFEDGYKLVIRWIQRQPNLSVQSQVILTPTHRVAEQFLNKSQNDGPHLSSLFQRDRPGTPAILLPNRDSRNGLNFRDIKRFTTPFVDVELGLADNAFVNHADATTYLVFVLANESTALFSNSIENFKKAVSPNRPLSTVNTFNLVPKLGSFCDAGGETPRSFLSVTPSQINWAVNPTEGNLCGDASDWAEQIETWVQDHQIEFRLGELPEDEDQIRVFKGVEDTMLTKNVHYTYDGPTNSIKLKPENFNPPLVKGTAFRVHVRTRPPSPFGEK